jgi:hypothetical protein
MKRVIKFCSPANLNDSGRMATKHEPGRNAPLERLITDVRDLSRSQPWQVRKNLGHQGQRFIKLGAASHENHHRDLKFGGVLLKTQVAGCCEENVKFFLSQREQLAVFDAAPAIF